MVRLEGLTLCSFLRCFPNYAKFSGQKHQAGKTSVHRLHGTYLSGTLLLDHELSDWVEGGNLSSWSKKQRAFSLSLLVVLSVSFNQFSKEKKYILQKG